MATTEVEEVVVVDTLEVSAKVIRVQFVDENGDPVDVTGGSFKLQGTSEDIAAVIDETGVAYDAANGIVDFQGAGGFLTLADLGGRAEVTFTMRAKLTDASSKVDWTPTFPVRFAAPPDVTP